MRYISGIFLAMTLLAACQGNDTKTATAAAPGNSSQERDTAQLTTVQWLDSTKDFGKIVEGQRLEVAFRFKNTGDKPLVIERVQPSCGCTIAEQPKEPIAPGAEGQVKASFDSKSRVGTNHKSLTVFANMKEARTHMLEFTVQVEKSPS
jgi:hypothetical protein